MIALDFPCMLSRWGRKDPKSAGSCTRRRLPMSAWASLIAKIQWEPADKLALDHRMYFISRGTRLGVSNASLEQSILPIDGPTNLWVGRSAANREGTDVLLEAGGPSSGVLQQRSQ